MIAQQVCEVIGWDLKVVDVLCVIELLIDFELCELRELIVVT